MNSHTAERERLVDLLCSHATEGLDDRGLATVQDLLPRHPDLDPDSFELAAAAIDRALSDEASHDPLPAHLEDSLRGQAAFWHRTQWQTRGPRWLVRSVLGWAGWAAAAAALLVLAMVTFRDDDPGPAPSPDARLATLLAEAPDVVRGSWKPAGPEGAPDVSGEFAWSDSRQEGYMRLVGVPPNDPAKRQYQLWIVDPARDARHPVDGGVFDVPAGRAEVVVPIRTKLPVKEPQAFVLTLEQPGGVVVSAGPHLYIAQP